MSVSTSSASVATPSKTSMVVVAGAAIGALIVVAVVIAVVVLFCCRSRARQRQLAAQRLEGRPPAQAYPPTQSNSYAFQTSTNNTAPPYNSPYPASAYPVSPFLGNASPAPSYTTAAVGQKQAWPVQPLPSTNEQNTFELNAIPNKNPEVFELDSGNGWSPLDSNEKKGRK
jgi:hypothetical protein